MLRTSNSGLSALERLRLKAEELFTSEITLQRYEDGVAGDEVPLTQYIEDTIETLGMFMTECKYARGRDPLSRNYFQGMRTAACKAVIALEHLQSISER